MITLVQSQMTTELNRIQGHLEGLEQEISKLKRKQSEVEQLSHTDDHIYFLQVKAPPELKTHQDAFWINVLL